MQRWSIALLAFGLGIVATPVMAILVYQTAGVAIAQEEDLVVVQQMDDDLDPKEVYLNLVKSKLSLMAPEQLQRETESLRAELFELQATEKLRDAQRKLEEVIEQHPNTNAAARARNMLKIGDQTGPGRQRAEPFENSDPFAAPRHPGNGELVPARRRGNDFDTVPARRATPPENVPDPTEDLR